MKLNYIPLALALYGSAHAAGTTPQTGHDTTHTLVATLQQYNTIREEIADIENKIKETVEKTEKANNDRAAQIAKLKEQYKPHQETETADRILSSYGGEGFLIHAPSILPSDLRNNFSADYHDPSLKTVALDALIEEGSTFLLEGRSYGASFGNDTLVFYATKTEGTGPTLVLYEVHDSHIRQGQIVAHEGEAGTLNVDVSEYLELDTDAYALMSKIKYADLNIEQQTFVTTQYGKLCAKVTPHLDRQLTALKSRKPALTKQLSDAEKAYARSQLPPGI